MRLDQASDNGADIQNGDVVFIKAQVKQAPDVNGDCRVALLPRNGKQEHAAIDVNSVFLKRPASGIFKRLLNWITR